MTRALFPWVQYAIYNEPLECGVCIKTDIAVKQCLKWPSLEVCITHCYRVKHGSNQSVFRIDGTFECVPASAPCSCCQMKP